MLVLVVYTALGAPARAQDPLSRLEALVGERLLVIDEVARSKWNARLPATDPAREAELLQSSIALSAELGLDEDFARAILESQLAASRFVQESAFARWRLADEPPFTNTRDLTLDLRPELDALTREILIAAQDAKPALVACTARSHLEQPPHTVVDAAAWSLAVRGLIPAGPCTP